MRNPKGNDTICTLQMLQLIKGKRVHNTVSLVQVLPRILIKHRVRNLIAERSGIFRLWLCSSNSICGSAGKFSS